MRETPEGIEEAEEAALALEQTLGAPPRLASPAYLDALGAATRASSRRSARQRLAVRGGDRSVGRRVEAFVGEVERGTRLPLRVG